MKLVEFDLVSLAQVTDIYDRDLCNADPVSCSETLMASYDRMICAVDDQGKHKSKMPDRLTKSIKLIVFYLAGVIAGWIDFIGINPFDHRAMI